MAGERERRSKGNGGALDLKEGDIVQLVDGNMAGRVGMVIGITCKPTPRGEPVILYALKFSDIEGRTFTGRRLRLVRPADDSDSGEI